MGVHSKRSCIMTFFKLLFKQLAALILLVAVASIYIWGFFKLLFYTFSNWWIQNDGNWDCGAQNRVVTSHTVYCHPIWLRNNIHWGVVIFCILWIAFSAILVNIIGVATKEAEREKLRKLQ